MKISRLLKKFYSIQDLIERWEMDRKTVVKILDEKEMRYLRKGRGGKRWIFGKEIERFENGR